MPSEGYHPTEFAYSDDISFGRLFLGMGPKKIRQPVQPRPAQVRESFSGFHRENPEVVLTLGRYILYTSLFPSYFTTFSSLLLFAFQRAQNQQPTEVVHQSKLLTCVSFQTQVVEIKKPAAVAQPAPPPPAAAAAPGPWTDVQDALLLGLKALGKTWREIGAMVPGRETEDLRDRYTELTASAGEETKGASDTASGSEEETDTSSDLTESEASAARKKTRKDKKKNKSNPEPGPAEAEPRPASPDPAPAPKPKPRWGPKPDPDLSPREVSFPSPFPLHPLSPSSPSPPSHPTNPGAAAAASAAARAARSV